MIITKKTSAQQKKSRKNQRNEKVIYGMGENICKLQQGVDIEKYTRNFYSSKAKKEQQQPK